MTRILTKQAEHESNQAQGWAWWHEPLIPALECQKQDDSTATWSADQTSGQPGLHC